MFKELVDLGTQLEKDGKLPPVAFYEYADPIRWVVHLWPDHVALEKVDLFRARPFSGRTNKPEASLLVDLAAYSLGTERQENGGRDKSAKKKHETCFLPLQRSFLGSEHLKDPALREAIGWFNLAIDQRLIEKDERYGEITSKDWISFVPEQGPLSETHLFEHPDAKSFWISVSQRRCSADSNDGDNVLLGTCSVCGRSGRPLIRKLPLKVSLGGIRPVPLHSLNRNAFTSFGGNSDEAHLGLCYECGDIASRAFNFLGSSDQHLRQLIRQGNRESFLNQYAMFWLRAPAPIRTSEQIFDPNEPSDFDPGSVADRSVTVPAATLSQLLALLKQPWTPRDSAFQLDDYAFYLALLSPNVGRIAVRDWISITITELKRSLVDFLDGTSIMSSQGVEVNPVSVSTIIEAIGTGGADLTRALLRCAYCHVSPPSALAIQAGQRLNHLNANEYSLRERQINQRGDQAPVWRNEWPQALAAAVKLGLFYRKEEVETMAETNHLYKSKAYQCGRLLALFEEAQQLYSLHQNGERLKVSIIQRGYGGASSTPAPVFGRLFRIASSAHLPVADRWFPNVGRWVNKEVRAVSSTLTELGGIPQALSLAEQAEFGLGFYHQRASICARLSKGDEAEEVAEEDIPA